MNSCLNGVIQTYRPGVFDNSFIIFYESLNEIQFYPLRILRMAVKIQNGQKMIKKLNRLQQIDNSYCLVKYPVPSCSKGPALTFDRTLQQFLLSTAMKYKLMVVR